MGPRRSKIWLPLARLGAFFVAVVATGNIVLHALRPVSDDDRTASPDRSVDYYTRKKKRLEKQLQRTMEKFMGPPASTSGAEKVGTFIPVDPTTETIACTTPAAAEPPVTMVAMKAVAKDPVLGFVAPEPAPFVWPEPLPALAPTRLELPTSLAMMEETSFRTELVTDFYRRGAADPVADVGDAILKGPEMLLDGLFSCTSGLGSRPLTRGWDDDAQRSVMAQILDVQTGIRKERIWSEFMAQLTNREAKYLANFGESRGNTLGFEDRTADVDLDELLLDQRKVLWDALRRTYLARYKVQAEEKIRDDAFYLDRWSGADYVLLPPLMSAYVYYRGLEKKFTIAGTRLSVSIEPLSEWVFRKRDLAAAAAIEWKIKDWPLGVIVSVGQYDGHYGLDFVGIGTSLGAARRAIVMQQGDRHLGERR
jgi:hypothetical protein